MHPQFLRADAPAGSSWAFVYTGSIGDFRYRFAMDKDAGVHTAVAQCNASRRPTTFSSRISPGTTRERSS